MEIVSFKIAKKLKAKGFPQHITEDAYIIDNYGEEEYNIGDRLPIPLIPDYMDNVAAPIISQVLKWLREEKKIHICIDYDGVYSYDIVGIIDCEFKEGKYGYENYELAALAGIEYVIDNLI